MANAYYRGCGTARQPSNNIVNGGEENDPRDDTGRPLHIPGYIANGEPHGLGRDATGRARRKQAGGGPPKDVDGAIAVLREAVAGGVNYIDASDSYGPHVTNQSSERRCPLTRAIW